MGTLHALRREFLFLKTFQRLLSLKPAPLSVLDLSAMSHCLLIYLWLKGVLLSEHKQNFRVHLDYYIFIYDLRNCSAFCGGREVEELQRETWLPFTNTALLSQNIKVEVKIKHSAYKVVFFFFRKTYNSLELNALDI